jgi:hypothetical protein
MIEIELDDINYYTNDLENGNIYENKMNKVGKKVGYFKDGEANMDE